MGEPALTRKTLLRDVRGTAELVGRSVAVMTVERLREAPARTKPENHLSRDVPLRRLEGKTALVTGGSAGIGRATAEALARQGARVVILSRNRERAELAQKEIQEATGNPHVELITADLSSRTSMATAVEELRGRYPRIDVLVNNGGGAWIDGDVTSDGVERTFATHHLGHFQLTLGLLDLLGKDGGGRVINIVSPLQRSGELDFDKLRSTEGYTMARAFSTAKFAQVLFTKELSRRVGGHGVSVNALDPGPVKTDGWKHTGSKFMPALEWASRAAFSFMYHSPEHVAADILTLAASPAADGLSGEYFTEGRRVPSTAKMEDAALAARLWEESERMLGALG